MKAPESLNVIDKHGGFTAITTKRGDTLWRPGNVLKNGTVGKLTSSDERSFFQSNEDVTKAVYKVPGYKYQVAVWFNNKTGDRIS
jgi:hypothetical protein